MIQAEEGVPSSRILQLTVDGTINPIVADYIEQGIERGEKEGFSAVVIQLDTPGGLDTSMRTIVKAMEESGVLVIVYVAPSGARAASAGVFIMLASHVAAMSPGTNLGAAHPVAMGGEKMDETMSKKVEHDAAAYIRGIAEKHGRNAEWAEKAVRESVSITAEEAVKINVIDYVASSLPELLEKIDQKEIPLGNQKSILQTKGAEIVLQEMGLRHRVLNTLSDPNIAYILMMIGMWGLFFELSNPGAIFPGVIGGISLILGLVALQTLPINYAGILLILLGVILFIAEIKIVSYGFLTIGGIICLTLGSLMLFNSGVPGFQLSLKVVAAVVGATTLVMGTGIFLAITSQRRRVRTGVEGLIGERGTVREKLDLQGKVFLHGELWNAVSSEPIEQGVSVKVIAVEGMVLQVERTQGGLK
ncbi:MAG: nodulation protein NfeD [Deltaproteobacteria bacterium]|nr:nodulation protein NfeD [Deltaproteobacteria bacterium]